MLEKISTSQKKYQTSARRNCKCETYYGVKKIEAEEIIRELKILWSLFYDVGMTRKKTCNEWFKEHLGI